MRKMLLVFLVLGLRGIAQTDEKRWNFAAGGGLSQYAGDLGNDFYKFGAQPFYGHIGVQVSRYLTRHLDAAVFYTYGDLGHFENTRDDDPNRHFVVRPHTLSALLRYNILSSEYTFRPYIFAGAGVLRHSLATNDVDVRAAKVDYSIPSFGFGVKMRIWRFIGLQLQETFHYTTADDVDFHTGGMNDTYLLHTLMFSFDMSFKRTKKGGIGEAIDKCTDVSKRGKKIKP